MARDSSHATQKETVNITAAQRKLEVETSASNIRSIFELEAVQSLTAKQVIAAQNVLRNGAIFGIWETPREWAPIIAKNLYRVNLRKRIAFFLPTSVQEHLTTTPSLKTRLNQLLDRAVLRLTQYCILCRIGPAGLKRSSNEPLDPTTIATIAYNYLPRMAAAAIARLLQDQRNHLEGNIFSAFKVQDLIAFGHSVLNGVEKEAKRMQTLSDKGYWNDTPPYTSITKTTPVAGKPIPRRLTPEINPYRHLPDDYVSELASKAFWIIENLGPNIISILEKFHPLWTHGKTNSASNPTISRWCSEICANVHWKDIDGNEINELPFPIRLSDRGLGGFHYNGNTIESSIQWPPKGASHIFGLANALQTAHQIVVLITIAPRASEILTLMRDCVTYAKDGRAYANGRTYKLTKQLVGVTRDWVIPDFTAQAIEQQIRLISIAEPLTSINGTKTGKLSKPGTHLWGMIGASCHNRTMPMGAKEFNKALREFAAMLGMDRNPGGQSLSSHRFRKTIARLAALAIVEAPKILMDVFGHKSIEMVLYYILENKDLRGEIETIARELRVMRATTVIEEMVAAEEALESVRMGNGSGGVNSNGIDLGGYGGLAAIRIHDAIQIRRTELHKTGSTWGVKDMHELAELLTMRGTTWQLVRPGVVCTKAAGDVGPCNKRKGNPEPSRCQVSCASRLEEAWHQEDVDASIAEAVNQYIESGKQGSDLIQSFWRNQILGNLPRFPQLHTKWLANDVVQRIVQSEQQA